MSSKSFLKAAREAITKKDYSTAKKNALKVLDFEGDNYNAHVFLGLAFLELGELDDSEKIYRKATKLQPAQPLAWQGLSNFYERTGKSDQQAGVLEHLLQLFNTSKDATKCAETLQKLVALRRRDGSKSDLIASLSHYLPESELYPLLSTLPSPDPSNPTATTTFEAQTSVHEGYQILSEIVSLTESLETDTYRREVEKRRTRLGAGTLEVVQKEVFLEIATKSKLPDLYNAILSHPKTPDDVRTEIETKLLANKRQYLYAIPRKQEDLKRTVLAELEDLVNTTILLHKPDQAAWDLYLEWVDCDDLAGYDRRIVREYVEHFPTSDSSLLFQAYFAYVGESLDEEDEESEEPILEDPLDSILKVSSNASGSVLFTRLLCKVHLMELDYENTIKVAKQGLRRLQQIEADTGKAISRTKAGLQAALATGLTHYFPPKHHQEATSILDEVLAQFPQNTDALMARAFIYSAALEWPNAADTFSQVSSALVDDLDLGLRAREERAWCLFQLGSVEEGILELQSVLTIVEDLDDESRNPDIARCLWRMGKFKNDQDGYGLFIAALKKDPEFAPAFTSLGIYYAENASPPDPIRAAKCFQKAFELDARETVAARRLADSFANEREWDLVEVIAQRTIDGEGGLNAGMDKADLDASKRYTPTNTWAWKAIGSVKFHRKDYPPAIQAFQVCLRVEPEDQLLWVRLGEAYAKAGRHAAALKALHHGLEMKPDDWLCSYFIAEVKRSMGLYDDAIQLLGDILRADPDNAAPLVLLGQSHLDHGLNQLTYSFRVRAESSFLAAIEVALRIIDRLPGFRSLAWKMIGDAASYLSRLASFVDEQSVRSSLSSVPVLASEEWASDIVENVKLTPQVTSTTLFAMALAVHAYLSRISLSTDSRSTPSGCWFDLGIALRSWTIKASALAVEIEPIKDKSIEFFKKALQTSPECQEYWVALGDAYFVTQPKSAQHAYIKALEIDSKNASIWVNLGLLYFYHSDIDLANEAIYRAQVLDPDNTVAWFAQFLIARGNNDTTDATTLLAHSVSLARAVPEADYEHGIRTFNAMKVRHGSGSIDAMLPAFFVLNRYRQSRPNDSGALHLLALVCESLAHYSYGHDLVKQAIDILEIAYEETEDSAVERQYTIATCTLGRLKFAQGDFEGTVETFASALGLLSGDENPQTKTLTAQAHLGSGLALFYQEKLEEAIGHLEEALLLAADDSSLHSNITIALAQILWAIGSEEARESAKSRLLECISSDPENLMAINILAGMGILTADDGLVDAALSEILELAPDQRHLLDPTRHVNYLLIQHNLAQGKEKEALALAQAAVYTDPMRLDQRTVLASLLLGKGDGPTALALLEGAGPAIGSNDDVKAFIEMLSIQAVATSNHTKDKGGSRGEDGLKESLRKAQRAVVLRPSDPTGWRAVAYARAQAI